MSLTLTRPLPAPHQHGDFFIPAYKRSEIALAQAAAAATRPNESKQCSRLWDPFEQMRAALFRHKQPGDLPLHPPRYQYRARLGQRLHPRGNVGDVATNLAARVEDGGTGLKADTGDEFWFARSGVLAIEFGQGPLDRQRRAGRALGVVLVRQRITEQAHKPVAELFRDMTAHFGDRGRSSVEIRADEIAPLFGVELGGDCRRPDQIAEHDDEITALAGSLCRDDPRLLRGNYRRLSRGRSWRLGGWRGRSTEPCDRFQNPAAMAERGDPDFLQILIGQLGQN